MTNYTPKVDLEIGGQIYIGFQSISVKTSIENVCGSFSFTTVTTGTGFPFYMGDVTRVWIDGVKVLDGYIEKITIDQNTTEHNITASGRDKTCDIVDSTVGADLIFQAPITLLNVAANTLQKLAITGITVIDVAEAKPFKTAELISATVGETAFDFISKYAKLRQVLVTTDGQGNLIFTRTSSNSYITRLAYKVNESNIEESSASFDHTQRFHQYIIYSQNAPCASGTASNAVFVAATQTANVGGKTVDSEVRSSRTYNFQDDGTNQQEDTRVRCNWEANIRKAKSFTYTCKITGFKAVVDDEVWQFNRLVTITDENCLLDGRQMLIKDVEYDYSLETGAVTTLTLIPKDAFIAEFVTPKTENQQGSQSKVFVSGGKFGG